MFSKDLAGCVGHYFVEGVGQQVHVGIFVIQYDKWCKFSTYHCFECFCYIRIFKFLDVKFDSCWLWFADPLQANVEGCHQQVVITSDICSWKASCPGNVHPLTFVIRTANTSDEPWKDRRPTSRPRSSTSWLRRLLRPPADDGMAGVISALRMKRHPCQ